MGSAHRRHVGVCRSGEAGSIYPWGNEFREGACNSVEQRLKTTSPTTQFPNGISWSGGYDFAGIVWELVEASDQPPRGMRAARWLVPQQRQRGAFVPAPRRRSTRPSRQGLWLPLRSDPQPELGIGSLPRELPQSYDGSAVATQKLSVASTLTSGR